VHHVSEDSPQPRTPSNPVVPALAAAAELLLHASGAERLYLVVSGDEPDGCEPRLKVLRSERDDGDDRPSRTVLRRALRAGEPFLCPDVRVDSSLATGASIRALSLRSVVCIPLPPRDGRRAAIVLDSRRPTTLRRGRLHELVARFSSLMRALGLNADVAWPEAARTGTGTSENLVGDSPALSETLRWASRAARCNLPVLILGETGTGKERLAHELHARSPRNGRPFVAVNCAALTETLLEAELFGAVRGAYTGADRDRAGLFRIAEGGTLMLDEVGELSPTVQAKLLRALQERRVRPVGADREIPIDTRVLAATHVDLAAEVGRKTFRADLYYRLAVIEVRVPPLRERLEDLEALVRSLTPRLRDETGGLEPRLAPCAWSALRHHTWPGNVRELHTVIARALLRTGGALIRQEHLDLHETAHVSRQPETREREMIRRTLREYEDNLTQTAHRIGWTRQKLYRRMRALSIAHRPPRSSI